MAHNMVLVDSTHQRLLTGRRERGKHRLAASLYSGDGCAVIGSSVFQRCHMMRLSQSCIVIAAQVTLHHKHLNRLLLYGYRSIGIDAAHTHVCNHEAQDLRS